MTISVVLDTNIFISGIFWEGNYCSQIIDAWRAGKMTLISSLEIVQELVGTLRDFIAKDINNYTKLLCPSNIVSDICIKM